MGWELPPSDESDDQLEHYYHYPGVTLGIHRSKSSSINYERMRTTHTNLSTEVFPIAVPKLTKEQAAHICIGQEQLVVTLPEIDTAGRFVFVTVLFYNLESVSCNCGCLCTSPFSEVIKVECEASCAYEGKRKVHFAPLVSVRLIK